MSDKDEVIDGIRATALLRRNIRNIRAERGMVGEAFYVDLAGNGGSDNNSGLSDTDPLLKIESALDLCTNGKHNYIFVMDYWDNDSFPITVDKTTVHIIGLGNARFGPLNMSWCAMASGAAATFELTAASHYCEIAGFQPTANGSFPAILVSAGVAGAWIHHNSFGSQIVTRDGILVTGDLSNSLVEDNIFGNYQSPLGRDGIRAGSITGTIIKRNLFIRPVGIGLNLGGQPLAILDNRFSLPSDDAGKAITLTTTGCFIDGNSANFGYDAAMSANPYVDSTGGDANTWGLNYRGGVSIYPAT